MQRYFILNSQIQDDRVTLNESDSHHIKAVMRQRIGDQVICFDENQHVYQTTIQDIEKSVVLCINHLIDEKTELDVKVTLIYGLPKLEKFEMVIQKATELGVSTIIPWFSKRSIIKLDDTKINKKMVRWQMIVKEAAEQSHRHVLPEILEPMSTKQVASFDSDVKLIAYENDQDHRLLSKSIVSLKPGQSMCIVVGPEGGIEESELKLLEKSGYLPASLGKRILRTETAAIVAISAISLLRELGE